MMEHYKGIIAIGTFSGLVIITLLALGFSSLGVAAESGPAVPQDEIQLPLPQTVNVAADEALQAWQQYAGELEQTVLTMQDRENTYQSQMDLANQTILSLQDQLNTPTGSAGSGGFFSDDGSDVTHLEHERFEEHEINDD